MKKLFVLCVASFLFFLLSTTSSFALDETTNKFSEQLFRDYGIRILKSETEHSPSILENLVFLLQNGMSTGLVKKIKTFRYLKAARDKNSLEEMSSFNLREKSITIPGIEYDQKNNKDLPNRVRILAALAHEIGHAYLFQNLKPEELLQIGDQYGDWGYQESWKKKISSLQSELFFIHHPKYCRLCKVNTDRNHFSVELRKNNITSEYALEDIHEWFAESFAAYLLISLGRRGLLGENWQESLVVIPHRNREYWINYNNLSEDFFKWFEYKLNNS